MAKKRNARPAYDVRRKDASWQDNALQQEVCDFLLRPRNKEDLAKSDSKNKFSAECVVRNIFLDILASPRHRESLINLLKTQDQKRLDEITEARSLCEDQS